MDSVPEEVRALLVQHPSLELIQGGKVKCKLTGHELPCRLAELKVFTEGKKYKKLNSSGSYDYSVFQPHIVVSTKNPKQLFCKLTLRHMNKIPEEVQRHIEGKRYQKALVKYKECQKEGKEYVPACLLQKKRQKHFGGDGSSGKKDTWEPTISNSEDSDSGDSMSDLYPDKLFTKKTTKDELNGNIKSSDEDMDVDSVPTQNRNKRQQKQNGPAQKKFKKHHQKAKHFKKSSGK
ncbi:surfeit locus 2 [Pelobates cultripes]|uniref:Surfeit locus 2 n=1 Tax=Pelobates cultripes TaxID=61616 RepID=A0AAD1T7U2_PELCU|nr:surfeit locus 2 [Pelobates cultripes]